MTVQQASRSTSKQLERSREAIETTMFIRVKYRDDETLLCNPNCVVVNLLSSIKTRSGHADTETVLDLADETGLFRIRTLLRGHGVCLSACPVGILTVTYHGQHATRPAYISARQYSLGPQDRVSSTALVNEGASKRKIRYCTWLKGR